MQINKAQPSFGMAMEPANYRGMTTMEKVAVGDSWVKLRELSIEKGVNLKVAKKSIMILTNKDKDYELNNKLIKRLILKTGENEGNTYLKNSLINRIIYKCAGLNNGYHKDVLPAFTVTVSNINKSFSEKVANFVNPEKIHTFSLIKPYKYFQNADLLGKNLFNAVDNFLKHHKATKI